MDTEMEVTKANNISEKSAYILNKINDLDPDIMLDIINTRFNVSKDKAEIFANDNEIICGMHDEKITVSLLSIINSILTTAGYSKIICITELNDDNTVSKIAKFDYIRTRPL